MNAPVVTLHPGGVVTREQIDAVQRFEVEMQSAIERVKETGAPQGFVVALLHAFAARETQALV